MLEAMAMLEFSDEIRMTYCHSNVNSLRGFAMVSLRGKNLKTKLEKIKKERKNSHDFKSVRRQKI